MLVQSVEVKHHLQAQNAILCSDAPDKLSGRIVNLSTIRYSLYSTIRYIPLLACI